MATLQELRKTKFDELAKAHKYVQDVVTEHGEGKADKLAGDHLIDFKNGVGAFDALHTEYDNIVKMIRAEATEHQIAAEMVDEATKVDKYDLTGKFLELETRFSQGQKGMIHLPMPKIAREGKIGNAVRYAAEGVPEWKYAYSNKAEEYALLGISTANIAAALPRTMADVVGLILNNSPILGYARVFQTPTGHTMKIPMVAGHGSVVLHGEGAPITPTDVTFAAPPQLDAYEAAQLVTDVSKQYLRDFPGGEGLILEALAEGMGQYIDEWLVDGTGANQPEGLLAGIGSTNANNVTTAANDKYGYVDIVKVVTRLKAKYTNRPSCVWITPNTGIEQFLLVRDDDNRPLFNLNMQDAIPMRMFNYPVLRDDNMAAFAAGSSTTIFGSLDEFWVRMVGGLEIASSSDYQFNKGTMAYRSLQSLDSVVVRKEGLLILITAS